MLLLDMWDDSSAIKRINITIRDLLPFSGILPSSDLAAPQFRLFSQNAFILIQLISDADIRHVGRFKRLSEDKINK